MPTERKCKDCGKSIDFKRYHVRCTDCWLMWNKNRQAWWKLKPDSDTETEEEVESYR